MMMVSYISVTVYSSVSACCCRQSTTTTSSFLVCAPEHERTREIVYGLVYMCISAV